VLINEKVAVDIVETKALEESGDAEYYEMLERRANA
jgi:hypothetical protein